QHAKNRATGYEREGLIMLRPKSQEYYEKYHVLVNELRSLSSVQSVGTSNYPITNTLGWNGGFSWTGKDPNFLTSFNTIRISPEYAQTLGLEFITGQDFAQEVSTGTNKVLINEAASEIIELDKPVGAFLNWERDGEDRGNFQIIGVVKNMVKGSPFEPVSQSIMFISEAELGWLFIRLNPSIKENTALAEIRERFNQIVPSAPFDYTFVEDDYAAKFGAEERTGTLSAFFTGLALLISCLGLFGLASYVAERRTKEIGIRKVLGASMLNVWQMLSKDFVILVLIACLIASPIAYYFLQNWLESYAYRIEISWWTFISTYISALVLTLVTISYQALKAASTNPVECLRAE
ncbi:MAG: FtsX-like permease family protein, partial [Bacteroidota bacterium]